MTPKYLEPTLMLLGLAYCTYLYFAVHSFMVTAVSVIVSLVFICCYHLMNRQYEKTINETTNQISENLERLLSQEYQKVDDLDLLEETLVSKINHKIVRIAEVLRIRSEQSVAEKKVLQGFISDISHQVKTPMTNLKMLHETIQDRQLPESTRNELQKLMGTQFDKMEFLLSFLVKTSRLEAGLIQLNSQPGNLFDTLAGALSDITVLAARKNIEIKVNCSEVYPLSHDIKWTTEALFNILENAVKYSPDNSVIVVAVEHLEMYTRINITDHGIGISEANYGKIFQRFYRGESNLDTEGLGIGLYLAREIIQKQKGYIMVRSVIGTGSTFSVFLPNEA